MDDPSRAVGSAEATRRYVEQMPIGMVSFRGPELTFVMANASYRVMVGREDLVGMPVRAAFPEAQSQGFFEMMERVRRTGESARVDAMRAELIVDGSGTPSEIFLDMVLVAALDDAGEMCGLHGYTIDVTARVQAQRRAEQQARVAERRYADAQAVVRTLQQALLPVELPVLPSLDVAARYLLAGQDEAAGGDWFDAVVRPDGTVALVVGDVVGHGVAASAVMGQLRAVLHDHLISDEPLEAALASLDRFARTTPAALYTTVCVVEIDPASGAAEYCTAGHPPPLVVGESETAFFVETTGDGPLGTGRGFTTRTLQLQEDETVVLFSDGLIERPGRDPAESTLEILQVVSDRVQGSAFPLAESDRQAERICQETLELLTRVTGYADDVTILAARRTPMPVPFSGSWPVTESTDRDVRQQISHWLAGYDVGDGLHLAITHAVSELVANTVRHAYSPETDLEPGTGPGSAAGTTQDSGAPTHRAVPEVEVTADVDERGWLTCRVRDHGRWRQPTSRTGRGLMMVRGLVDELDVSHDDSGTRATARIRLGREARVIDSAEQGLGRHRAHATAGAMSDDFEVALADGLLTVHGAVDLVGATLLDRAIATASPSENPLVVDLSNVTHLGSAAVRVLYRATPPQTTIARADGASAPGHANPGPGEAHLRIIAPNGTVAQHVLDLVGLSFERTNSVGDV